MTLYGCDLPRSNQNNWSISLVRLRWRVQVRLNSSKTRR